MDNCKHYVCKGQFLQQRQADFKHRNAEMYYGDDCRGLV